MSKPFASLSLDMDNQWSYMKIHGEEGWESYPSYLDIFVPHVLKVLDELNLKITFFIVGQDAAFEKNHKYLRDIADAGHDIGNHSFVHETWLHLYSREEMTAEIDTAHDIIEKVTGKAPTGFRGPGFSWSPTLLEVLADKGYVYDASTLPTVIGPLARLYYFSTSNLSKEEKEDRKEIFGKFSDGFKKLKPYYWKTKKNQRLLELPVTTMPIFRIPFHLSYLIYISNISIHLMSIYLNIAIFLCKITKTQPSFLLHPLDLIGGDQITSLAFFPGMNVSSERKVFLFKKVMKKLGKHFTLTDMNGHVNSIIVKNELKTEQVPD
ncbi:polysaccharide deacetylase [Zobellia amurskyensis]|uniref:Polysaccharide deacetylase n=1 Tax=Zobellia amurskyensis TaxID=248905 RepID=A0A7X3D0T1_9FLAO|nr:polysaccharide deacetylase family protein [Zobellia amurskyensis]MUH35434.1 polysaccharide deacetylase [Zobellia amurskyensis]